MGTQMWCMRRARRTGQFPFMRSDRRGNPAAPSTAAELLASLGIVASQERESVTECVESYFRDRGVTVSVTSLRWGRLKLAADPVAAHLANLECHRLLAHLASTHPDVVTEINVSVTRS